MENITKELLEKIALVTSTPKGQYVNITYKSIQGHYEKVTNTRTRLINYYNMKEVKEAGITPSEPKENIETLIPHILTYNKKTGNYLLHVYKTYNKKHTRKCKYYKDGIEISKEEYLANTKPHTGDSPVITINLKNLISLG